MISVNATYTNLIAAGAGYEWRIVNGLNTFTVSNLISGSITSSMMEGLSIGNCNASQLNLTLWSVTPDTTNPMVVQFRANDGNGSTSSWYTKGTFYIDNVQSSPYSEEVTVTAFDVMLAAEVPYLVTGTWTETTDYVVLQAIADDMGVSVNSATLSAFSTNRITLSNAPNLGVDGTTERELLSCFAAMRGGNFIIDSEGKLKLITPYSSPVDTVTVGDNTGEFEASPSETVKRVRVWLNSDTFYYAPTSSGGVDLDIDAWEALGGFCIEITIPFYASQSIADSLLTSYGDKTFYPYTASNALIDPKYEIGDGASFDASSPVISVLASQTISLDGLALSNAELKGEEISTSSSYPYKTPTERAIMKESHERQASISVLEDSIVSRVSGVEQSVSNLENEVEGIQGDVSDLDSNVQSLEQRYESTVEQLPNQITTTITTEVPSMIQDGVDSVYDTLSAYLRYYLDANNHGVLELGDSQNDFIAQLTNEKLAFLQSGTEIAWLSNSQLHIKDAEIIDSLKVGNYKWLTDSTGRMSLKWVD